MAIFNLLFLTEENDTFGDLKDIADNTTYLGEISDMIDKLCSRIEDVEEKLEFINDRLGDLNETTK